jgi:hypothetical protein
MSTALALSSFERPYGEEKLQTHGRRIGLYTIDTFERSPEDLIAEEVGAIDNAKRPRPEQKRVWASLEIDFDPPLT